MDAVAKQVSNMTPEEMALTMQDMQITRQIKHSGHASKAILPAIHEPNMSHPLFNATSVKTPPKKT